MESIMHACESLPLRVQVLNNHILTQNLHYKYYYQNPKYLIIGYLDPLGSFLESEPETLRLRLGVQGVGSV